MKNKKKFFKNKVQMVIYIILFIICISLFIIIGKTDFNKGQDTEAKKISSIYNELEDNNLFVFANATDVLNIINGRSGIILFGFPSNKWTNYYAKYLNEEASMLGIEKIYYYDFLNDRKENNGTYETIVNKLNVYITVDDLGNKDIYAPAILIVKNGNIITYIDDTSINKGNVTPEIYYNENKIAETKLKFRAALEDYIN